MLLFELAGFNGFLGQLALVLFLVEIEFGLFGLQLQLHFFKGIGVALLLFDSLKLFLGQLGFLDLLKVLQITLVVQLVLLEHGGFFSFELFVFSFGE